MRADASLVNIKKNVISHQAISIGFVEVVFYNLHRIYVHARFCLQSKQGVTG